MAGPEDTDDSNSTKASTGGRCLRHRHKQMYSDEGIDDDEIDGKRTFDLQEKLSQCEDTTEIFYLELKGSDVTLEYFQKNGFRTPILVKEKAGLGLRIPSENFSVSDVKKCVGSSRVLDVVDVTTQKDLVMTVKEWVQYFENPIRERLLNVISLEFSHTKLENYVDQPAVIHDMDWVDIAWPWYHKEFQRESANYLDRMMYPKVQKYCLMSVEGCYTDFHIDMGGTSVWYHILKGKKIFWFIEPTEENLQLYENWTLSAKQGDIFFGDMVDKCHRITLEAGWTFFIPTGWIHAVYTPMDSLVFGGNFLHSFSIPEQLRIWDVESRTHVPPKFRYPFFTEIHWYVVERYVSCLTGKQHRTKSTEERQLSGEVVKEETSDKSDVKDEVEDEQNICRNNQESRTIGSPQKTDASPEKFERTKKNIMANLTPYELEGLEAVSDWLSKLPLNKRFVPKDIADPDLLLADTKKLIKSHRNDDSKEAVTGLPILQWPSRKKPKVKREKKDSSGTPRQARPAGANIMGSVWNYRRIRCRACEPCTRTDCGECSFCEGMKKFGGPGTLKKPCVSRQCLQPLLPNSAVCLICGKGQSATADGLMECTICFEVVHPDCLRGKHEGMSHSGNVDEDYPSSWECARCCEEGKEGQGRARFRQLLVSRPPGEHRRRQRSVLSRSDSLDNGARQNEKLKSEGTKTFESMTDPRVVLKRVRVDPASPASSSGDTGSNDSDCSNSDDAPATASSQITQATSSSLSKKKAKFATASQTKTVPQQSAIKTSSRVTNGSDSDDPSAPASPPQMNSRGRAIAVPRRFLD